GGVLPLNRSREPARGQAARLLTRGSPRMPRPPVRRGLEGGCPKAPPCIAGFALFGLIGAVGDRLPGSDQSGADIHLPKKANRDGAAVTIFFARPAAKFLVLHQRFQEARCRAAASPRVAGAFADLPEFRGVDPVEPDLDAGDAD